MRLHHIGWVGRSIEHMRRGFERDGARQVSEPIVDPTQGVVVQFVSNGDNAELWELVAPLGAVETSPLASRLHRGGGLDHVCYELEPGDGSLEQILEAEGARGGRVVCKPVMAAAFGRRIAFVYKRSGRLIEYVESRQPAATL